ncbi:hypothetical protein [Microbacterium sp. A93]|uniref:hypothetical protein n=1 Tax=unclassified Microbacterium TaxID=2609290 RepID=UPI003F4388CD
MTINTVGDADVYDVHILRSVKALVTAARARGRDNDVAMLINESAELLTKRQPRGGALSQEQVNFLITSGAFTSAEFVDTETHVAGGGLAREEREAQLASLLDTSSATEVAQMLGIDDSRVRHRQSKGLLYAFLTGGKRRYPLWQFTGNSTQPVLPGLAAIVEAIPEGMHPASVEGFMSTPQEDLRMDSGSSSVAVTPIEWLLKGGDIKMVVGVLDSFLQS